MTERRITHHAEVRMQQRGRSPADLDVLDRFASELPDGSRVMLDKDVVRATAWLKRELRNVERLRGCKAVYDGDVLITFMHSSKRHLRKVTRRHRGQIEPAMLS